MIKSILTIMILSSFIFLINCREPQNCWRRDAEIVFVKNAWWNESTTVQFGDGIRHRLVGNNWGREGDSFRFHYCEEQPR